MKLSKKQTFSGDITIKGAVYRVEFVCATDDRDDNEGSVTIRPAAAGSMTYRSALKFLQAMEDEPAASAGTGAEEAAPTPPAPAPAAGKKTRQPAADTRQVEIPNTKQAPAAAAAGTNGSPDPALFAQCTGARSVVKLLAEHMGDRASRTKIRASVTSLLEAGVEALVGVEDLMDKVDRYCSSLGIEE